MACYHPLKGFAIGKTDNDKIKYKITSYKADHVEITDKSINVAYDKFISPYAKTVVSDFIEIPCGKCVGCRLDYSRQWADRCMIELQNHSESWFVTLTYDDDHLPLNDYVDPDGVIHGKPTLRKRDVQLFLKRLRKNYKYDNHIKYFCCGEYGGQTLRPHYHMIIFGLHLDDLVLYKRSVQGYNYYNSKFLTDCWQQQGFVVVTETSWDTCAYTARYILKKQYGSASDVYKEFNFAPEFTTMSLRPAIGREYFDANYKELYEYDYINVCTADGGRTLRPPRYYDRLYDVIDPDDLSRKKAVRKDVAIHRNKIKLSKTSLDYEQMLAVEEDIKIRRIKALNRNKIELPKKNKEKRGEKNAEEDGQRKGQASVSPDCD